MSYSYGEPREQQRPSRVIIPGATFTETMVLTIVNQLLQYDPEAYRERVAVANSMLLTLVVGDILLHRKYRDEFLETLREVFRMRFPQIPPPQPRALLALREELVEYIKANGDKIGGRLFLVGEGERIAGHLADEIIFTAIIAFFKKTGGLSDRRE